MNVKNTNPPAGELIGTVTRSKLNSKDDPKFWAAAIEVLLEHIEHECERGSGRHEVFLQIGACSHWLRPHQTRWTAAGGFAWPTGYGGGRWSRSGLPEFDWFALFHRNAATGGWERVERFSTKRQVVLRAALPARTVIHNQAAVHTTWLPGTPAEPRRKVLRFFGFRRALDRWIRTAISGARIAG